MSEQANFNAIAGRICWHAIREAVSQIRLQGMNIRLVEGQGWLEREFRVEGDKQAVEIAYNALRRWNAATS